jgi:hypothetical protein
VHHCNADEEEAGVVVAKRVLLTNSNPDGTIDEHRFDEKVTRTMDLILHDDSSSANVRLKIFVGYLREIFSRVGFLSFLCITGCISKHRSLDPGFWRPAFDTLHINITENKALVCGLVPKKSLNASCAIMYYLNQCISAGEVWCSHLTILEIGLGWLRNALLRSDNMIKFDNLEQIYPHEYKKYCDQSNRFASVFEQDGISLFDNARYKYRPKLIAMTLICLVKRSVADTLEFELVQQPQLSGLC